MYKRLLIFALILISFSTYSKTHLIPTATVYVDGAGMGIQPGDTIFLEAGLKPYLMLKNFHGSAEKYITFINHNGKVEVFNNNFSYGIVTYNCTYFRLTGSGDPDFFYGITITASNGSSNGLSLDEFSSDFEIDHIEVYNTGFAGIMSKTDPRCDSLSCRGFFTQYNSIFHDNYVHKTGGEGFYIGHSYYAGYKKVCGNDTLTLYPHDLINVKVYNNIIDSTGYDGIQMGCVIEGCEVYNNVITNAGITDNALGLYYGMSGIVMGGGTSGLCYNNFIYDGYGTGISIFGLGDMWIFNNVILDAGRNSRLVPGPPDNHHPYGIFCDDRTTIAGSSFNLINNTIVNPRDIAIRFWSLQSANNRMYNNLIINPGVKQWDFNRSMIDVTTPSMAIADTLSAGNYFDSTNYQPDSNIYFLNIAEKDFHLKPGAPNIDKGIVLDSILNMSFDFDYKTRPMGRSTDAGAFEFSSLPELVMISPADTALCEGLRYELTLDSIFPGDVYTFQWFLNDSAISGRDSAVLIIDTLTVDDAGTYKLSFSNGFAEAYSNEAVLNVIQNPTVWAGKDTTICFNYIGLRLLAEAENFSHFFWSTNGDGIFETDTALQSFYFPGEEDKINGSVVISATTFAESSCDSVKSELTLTLDACTGIEDVKQQIRVYPNPTGDQLTIDSGNDPILSLKLTDLKGSIILEKTLNNHLETINIREFDSGIYILLLLFRNKTEVRKVIKQ